MVFRYQVDNSNGYVLLEAIAVQPEVILMDEPASALDPISTLRIEELLQDLKQQYTIVIVTHNMQQASRVSDMTAFFNVEPTEKGGRIGYLVEYDKTEVIFQRPQQEATQQYVSGASVKYYKQRGIECWKCLGSQKRTRGQGEGADLRETPYLMRRGL